MAFTLRKFAALGAHREFQQDCWVHAAAYAVHDVDPILQELAGAMTAAGFPHKDVFAVRLAVEEAVVNAIKHGHQGDTSKEVRVGYSVLPEQVTLVVEDEGPGFQPDEVPDPLDPENLERACGRGVFLMRHYMNWVKYNERGNSVTMCKRRTS